jgi:hypothetical protein
MSVRGIGLPLARDPDGTLREGPIVVPLLSQELSESIYEALHELHFGAELRTPPIVANTKLQKPSSVVRESLLKKAIDLQGRRRQNLYLCLGVPTLFRRVTSEMVAGLCQESDNTGGEHASHETASLGQRWP